MPTFFLNGLIDLDHALFAKLNLEWTNSFFDWFFPRITDLHKDPRSLFVVLPLVAFWIWRQRARAIRWIMVAVLSVAITDTLAYRVIKREVNRNRPQFSGVPYQLRTHEHTGPSFPSNHSSNAFAAATALSGGLPYLSPVFFGGAFLIAYSRVYDGVHFPLDVTAGAVLGILIALIVRRVFRKWLQDPAPDEADGDLSALANSVVRSDSRPKN